MGISLGEGPEEPLNLDLVEQKEIDQSKKTAISNGNNGDFESKNELNETKEISVWHRHEDDLIYMIMPAANEKTMGALLVTVAVKPGNRQFEIPAYIQGSFELGRFGIFPGDEMNRLLVSQPNGKALVLGGQEIKGGIENVNLNEPGAFILNPNQDDSMTLWIEITNTKNQDQNILELDLDNKNHTNPIDNALEESHVGHWKYEDVMVMKFPAHLPKPVSMLVWTINSELNIGGSSVVEIPQEITAQVEFEEIELFPTDKCHELSLIGPSGNDPNNIIEIMLNDKNPKAIKEQIDFNSPLFRVRNPNKFEKITVRLIGRDKNKDNIGL